MTLRANYPPVTLHLSLLWIEEFAGFAIGGALDDEAVRMVETAAVKVVIR